MPEQAKPETNPQPLAAAAAATAFVGVVNGVWASRALSAYAAGVAQRAFMVFTLIWLGMQAAFLHSPQLFGVWVLFACALCCSCAALVLAGLLTVNSPKVSAVLQGIGIVLVFASLAQGAYLGLPKPDFTWIFPALIVLPALYVALKRNLQFFALLGYVCGLCTPIFLGILQAEPRILFFYYLGLTALLPLIVRLTDWRLLNMLVFTWVFVVGAVFVYYQYEPGLYVTTQGFFMAFLLVYAFTLILRLRKNGFQLNNFSDFTLAAGISIWIPLFQMRLVVWNSALLIETMLFAALFFALLGVGVYRLLGPCCRVLSGIYCFIAFGLINLCLHMFIPGTPTLAALCIEGLVLFAWAGFKGMYIKKAAGAVILLFIAPGYFFVSGAHAVLGALYLGCAILICALLENKESRRLGVKKEGHVWYSAQELVLLIFGSFWWFGGVAAFSFGGMPEPGLVFFALSSACAGCFYALGKVIRFRALRKSIFLPLFISIPAALLPVLYQAYLEWPDLRHLASYNYLAGVGGLAWAAYFSVLFAALQHSRDGLVSQKHHAQFVGLVFLEFLLVITSSGRALALESGVSPAFLSILAVVPSLISVIVLSYAIKHFKFTEPYRRIMTILVPKVLFVVLGIWFVFSLSSLGDEAPGGKYLPLLNPVEFVQLASILAFGYWQRRLRKAKAPAPHLSAGRLYWVYGLCSFMWLHGLMFRVVQYFSQADVLEVFNFIELRFIFALIWVIFGVLCWIAATRLGSVFSWCCGAVLFFVGSIMLAWLSLVLWGRPMGILLSVLGATLLGLLCWLSPAPFTERGKRLLWS